MVATTALTVAACGVGPLLSDTQAAPAPPASIRGLEAYVGTADITARAGDASDEPELQGADDVLAVALPTSVEPPDEPEPAVGEADAASERSVASPPPNDEGAIGSWVPSMAFYGLHDVNSRQTQSLLADLGELTVGAQPINGSLGNTLTERALARDDDRCTLRQRVLLRSAVRAPQQHSECKLRDGLWWSPYEQRLVDEHEVAVEYLLPPVTMWHGGVKWLPREEMLEWVEREDVYTVMSREWRAARDRGRDGIYWPTLPASQCWWASEWVTAKTRFGFTASADERDLLEAVVVGCDRAGVGFDRPEPPPDTVTR